jgi:hypothetical protein
MLEHHPNRPLSDFRRILVLIFHDSILSQIEVSGNTGAVHRFPLRHDVPGTKTHQTNSQARLKVRRTPAMMPSKDSGIMKPPAAAFFKLSLHK